jgi:hypothetical protein
LFYRAVAQTKPIAILDNTVGKIGSFNIIFRNPDEQMKYDSMCQTVIAVD